MRTMVRFLGRNKIYSVLFCITLLIGLPPFIMYAMALYDGSLPSFEEWARYGGNHGPWHFSPQVDMIVNTSFTLLILSGATLVVSVIVGLRAKGRRFFSFTKGFVLALLQLLWAYLILRVMLWAID